jgi:hypothetical protein
MAFFKSLFGRQLGLGAAGNLLAKGGDLEVTRPCVDASITVGAEGASVANQRAITIQLKDANGNDINHVEEVELVLFLTADRLAYVVTGGSTGIAIGTDGALQTIVAKKVFRATSEADGDIDLTWTDTGTEAAYLGVRLPNGRYVMSDALTNAP